MSRVFYKLHVISHFILGPPLDRQTDKLHFISSSNWNIRKTDKSRSILFLILESRQDKQTDKLHFISTLLLEPMQDRQMDKLCFIVLLILSF